MAENRITRELESRSNKERPKSWQPASTLPEPDKQPGYAYRWVRVSMIGKSRRFKRVVKSCVRDGSL